MRRVGGGILALALAAGVLACTSQDVIYGDPYPSDAPDAAPVGDAIVPPIRLEDGMARDASDALADTAKDVLSDASRDASLASE